MTVSYTHLMCMLGTFSERATISEHSVVKIDDWLPLTTAVLVGCGVPTGWGTSVYACLLYTSRCV